MQGRRSPRRALADRIVLCAYLAIVVAPTACIARAPQVYRSPYYEAPVAGAADDVIFVGGIGFEHGDRVVYLLIQDAASIPPHPSLVPEVSSAEQGTARILNGANPSFALMINLPATINSATEYALWVVSPQNEWSEPFVINDPRPLWITPSYMYAASDFAGLGRLVRIVGRNLAARSREVRVRLQGSRRYVLAAANPVSGAADLQNFIIEAKLPPGILPGKYSVSISVDGSSWVDVPGQKFSVEPDPPSLPVFDISDTKFGHCRPNDGADDLPCLNRALESARAAGGAIIRVPAGTWDLIPLWSGSNREAALTLGSNIHLHGVGTARILWHDSPQSPATAALLLLEGNNSVTGLGFDDDRRFDSFERSRPVIQLGHRPDGRAPGRKTPQEVNRIVLAWNRFEHVGIGVAAGGVPIHELFVTHNEFAGYARDLELPGSPLTVDNPFRIDDGVIRWNRFIAGGYADAGAHQGVLATGLGASTRVDFSSNIADGASLQGLQSSQDIPGWRAAFFWNMSNNSEYLLVSDNRIDCPGDKAGDGEAIAFDANGDNEAYHGFQPVFAATRASLSVRGSLVPTGGAGATTSAYIGYWIQVVGGPGLGQTRKIMRQSEEPESAATVFDVSPAWDVVPESGISRVIITRQYWQAYVVGNQVRQSAPTCRKSNRNGPRGGVITLAGPAVDSVVQGNRQYGTDGIFVGHGYSVRTPSCPQCAEQAVFQTSVDVRNNLIDGEYDWNSDCSDSGIRLAFGASPTPEAPPPTIGFGVNVAHNEITRADGLRGGAINVVPTWHTGPSPSRWRLLEGLLVSHNSIREVNGPAPRADCRRGQTNRSGINIEGGSNVHGTVLYKNACFHVDAPLVDRGDGTLRICEGTDGGTCECPSLGGGLRQENTSK